MNTLPEAPAPAPKKRKIWPWVLGTVAVVLVLQAVGQMDEQITTPIQPIDVPTVEDGGLSDDTQMSILRLVWDTEMTAAERSSICEYYLTPPVGTTPEMVEAFANGAELSYSDAERLLDQLLAEEC